VDVHAGKSVDAKIGMPATPFDKALAKQIAAGNAGNVSPGMIASVKHAVDGCPK
jgi:hypothetical protein